VRLHDQVPAQASGLPRRIPPPALDEGPHFSYAVQWFTFTAIGLIGWPLLLRKAARDRQRSAGGRQGPASAGSSTTQTAP
jgi:cytochrome oxidase assembly protein ShyY1